MSKPVIIIGGGGHAIVLLDVLRLQRATILGYTDFRENAQLEDILWLGDDSILHNNNPSDVELINGVGSTGKTEKRTIIYNQWRGLGFRFRSIIHPFGYISPRSLLHEGVQIMAGAIIQPGTEIGCNSIVNTRASIDHDCYIGNHVHIAPGATLCGGVYVADGAHVGAGATINQGIVIGENSIVAAGAVVVRNVPAGVTVVGVPAKEAVT